MIFFYPSLGIDSGELDRLVGNLMSSTVNEFLKKIWSCVKCGYSCRNANNVRKHIERRHLSCQIACLLCPKTFSCRHDLNQHSRIYHT